MTVHCSQLREFRSLFKNYSAHPGLVDWRLTARSITSPRADDEDEGIAPASKNLSLELIHRVEVRVEIRASRLVDLKRSDIARN